jgi:hypothetical protein
MKLSMVIYLRMQSRQKDKMLGKIVRIKERTKRDLGTFSLTLLKGQYV